MASKIYYAVALSNSYILDEQGRYLRNAIAQHCGHLHRSQRTAEQCREKLLGWYKYGGQRMCNAHWYSAHILRVDRQFRHVPDKEAV